MKLKHYGFTFIYFSGLTYPHCTVIVYNLFLIKHRTYRIMEWRYIFLFHICDRHPAKVSLFSHSSPYPCYLSYILEPTICDILHDKLIRSLVL